MVSSSLSIPFSTTVNNRSSLLKYGTGQNRISSSLLVALLSQCLCAQRCRSLKQR